MKLRNLFLASLAAVTFAACSNDDDPIDNSNQEPADASLSIAVSSKGLTTRAEPSAEGLTGEANINNITAVLFDAAGNTAGYGKITQNPSQNPADTVMVTAKEGTYKLLILVNSEVGRLANLAAYQTATSDLEKETLTDLTMRSDLLDVTLIKDANYYGPKNKFHAHTQTGNPVKEGSIGIEVKRIAARIDLQAKVNWNAATKETLGEDNAKFILKGIQYVQVKKQSLLVGTSGNVESTTTPAALTAVTTNQTFTNGGAPTVVTGGTNIYVYKNTSSTTPTGIVLTGDIVSESDPTKVLLANRSYFIDVQATDAPKQVLDNFIYDITATIVGIGSDGPSYQDNAYITSFINVVNWTVKKQDAGNLD